MARATGWFERRALLALAAGVLITAGMPAVAGAPEADAEQVVQGLVEDIWTTLREDGVDDAARVEQLRQLLETRTDVALLSRLALGRHWQRLPEAQQADYQKLFRQVVLGSMARRLNTYAGDAAIPLEERFRILGSAPAGSQDILVRSKVFPSNGPPLSIDWRLRSGQRGPVIIDLIIEGASLLVAQRAEFAAVIERRDVEGLLAELRARAQST
jgi:phospholipid transport system substrate-binding protein